VFLVNSRQGFFCCSPYFYGQAFLRTYGRFFAEFLDEDSPVRLGVLHQPTCVGFRYGHLTISSRGFSRKRALQNFSKIAQRNFHDTRNRALPPLADLPASIPYAINVKSNNTFCILHFVTPSKLLDGAGILTCCPSRAPFGIRLGPTNPQLMFIAEEPLGFRRAGISPALWLLVPTFSLPSAPEALTGPPSLLVLPTF
jgi:hypothetical protein